MTESYFRNGHRINGEWSYSLQNCLEGIRIQFPHIPCIFQYKETITITSLRCNYSFLFYGNFVKFHYILLVIIKLWVQKMCTTENDNILGEQLRDESAEFLHLKLRHFQCIIV
ncbi:hypothetical protein BDFB_014086 [Asbolus verrucosus]|uniref:Uncharacterized protein n=1 Tax=Asbolus verrucosus TaxID=1661398 RepID=A0A482VRY7_ASBVE|nr:hypothetical protein BDFB_014086 [Asbolus verrucosus]